MFALFGEQLLRARGRVPTNELAGWLREAQDRHSKAIIGNTAERILQQVDCSVLTVKPDGFVSPVTVSAHQQPQVDEESDVGT